MLATFKKMLYFTGPAPNYFICFQINREDVARSSYALIKQLERAYRHPEDKKEFVQSAMHSAKHHVSLCVCSLENEDEVEKVKQVKYEIIFLFA